MIKKPKSLNRIEDKLETLDEASYRFKVLNACRQFKTSWIQLGQSLFAVQRDKLFRSWDFLTFEGYCQKELSIRQATAAKLWCQRLMKELIQRGLSRASPRSRSVSG